MTEPKKGGRQPSGKVPVLVRLPVGIVEVMDGARGDTPRSEYVEGLVRASTGLDEGGSSYTPDQVAGWCRALFEEYLGEDRTKPKPTVTVYGSRLDKKSIGRKSSSSSKVR